MKSLCFRCEHRAFYLETGSGPRAECKRTENGIDDCYCYLPVKPCTIRRKTGDYRPMLLGMLGCRVERAEDVAMMVARDEHEGAVTPYWLPTKATP
jgi:hypothetical protein